MRQRGYSRAGPTRVSGWAVAVLLEETARAGGDVPALLGRAGIQGTLDLLKQQGATVQRSNLALLVRECIQVLEARASEGSGHAPMLQQEFELLCYCLITCKSLKQVIDRAALFCQMLEGKAGQLALTTLGSSATFSMRTIRGRRDSSTLISDLLGLSSYHRLFSWMIGEHVPIDTLRLISDEYVEAGVVLELFHYPVMFNGDYNGFTFPAEYLNKPVIRSADALSQLLQLFPFDLVSNDLTLSSLVDTVHAIIKARLLRQDPIPTSQQFAGLFNVSNATFRRRMDDEGTSISKVKEAARNDLARELLQAGHLSVGEIAERLGFSSTQTFNRAFKSWSGSTPLEFQRDAQHS